MKGIFIAGTDTGAGKTLVTGMLGRFLKEKGCNIITQKWIQTGDSAFSSDIAAHLRIMGDKKDCVKDYLPYICPYIFKFSGSAHLSSALEGKRIDSEKIKRSFSFLARRFDYVIVEAIGGALVPLNKKTLVIDIARALNLPVIIVAANKLGAINHTLLTIEALRRRKMRITGIIFNNQSKKEKRIILQDNPRIVQALTGERILGTLPWLKDRDLLYREFIPIGKKFLITKQNG